MVNYPPKQSRFSEFINFKLMIFPFVVKIIYVLGCIGAVFGALFSIGQVINNVRDGAFVAGYIIGTIFGTIAFFFVFHIFLEFLVVVFSILDVSREIRDELHTLNAKNCNQSSVTIQQPPLTNSSWAMPDSAAPYAPRNSRSFKSGFDQPPAINPASVSDRPAANTPPADWNQPKQ